MNTIALGDVAKFINGFAFKPSDWGEEGIPIIRIQNLTGTRDEFNYTLRKVKSDFIVYPGDLLVSWSATLDVYRWTGTKGFLNQHIFKFFPYDGIDPDYLFFALKHVLSEISAKTHGSTMKHVTRGDFENTQILKLSPKEQHRLVDILSRAEGIVRLRREAQKRAQELIPALFLDMFGDPATNPKGWPIHRVSDFVARFEGGKNLQAGSEAGTKYRILKVSAVTSGIYRESESKPAPDRYIAPSNHFVRKGDLLFSRANTEELVGATAFVEDTNGNTLLPDKLWRFVWSLPVEPLYIFALFQSTYVRREMGKLSSGTSSSMRNISQAKLFSLALPVAPIDTQKAFSERLEQIRSIQSQQSIALEKAEATFQSLLHRAFAGQL